LIFQILSVRFLKRGNHHPQNDTVAWEHRKKTIFFWEFRAFKKKLELLSQTLITASYRCVANSTHLPLGRNVIHLTFIHKEYIFVGWVEIA